MNNESAHLLEEELLDGKLVDQEPLEDVEAPASRLAGNNQSPDFGDDVKGTLHEFDHK